MELWKEVTHELKGQQGIEKCRYSEKQERTEYTHRRTDSLIGQGTIVRNRDSSNRKGQRKRQGVAPKGVCMSH